ncbi:MAG: hypothetical protein MUP47_00785, partial [Phycisphaerae bacterium]|nr:hypothetical protein [Phycisphaerae bacterium]
DATADGTVVGEGGGLLILEEVERAKARGARIYAEVAGFGAACDGAGLDVLRPSDGGLDVAVTKALADAGLKPKDVDAIVAHGTAVPSEDRCEAEAWQRALGELAEEAPATAVTGAIGSLFAGAGGVELAVAAMVVHTGTVPPTVNFEAHPAGSRLNLSDQARSGELGVVVSAAFGSGGQSGACVLKRYEP